MRPLDVATVKWEAPGDYPGVEGTTIWTTIWTTIFNDSGAAMEVMC